MDHTSLYPTTGIDRRGTRRFKVNVPLSIIIEKCETPAFTHDLSNRGVYFYLTPAQSGMIGPEFEFVVELPPEITLSACCRIRCRGRLLRKESSSAILAGVAAEILEYSILREAFPAV
jgi:PilZ domain-containing protein